MDDITKIITKGTTPKSQSTRGEVNFVKIENINKITGQIIPTSYISFNEHNSNLKRSILRENDLLFSIAGTLGRVGIVANTILPANTNQALAIIRPLDSINIILLKYVLSSEKIKKYIYENPTIGAQPNLSLTQISNLEVALPLSSQEQKRISNLLVQLENCIFLLQRKEKKYNSFKKALLQNLFTEKQHIVPRLRFSKCKNEWRKYRLEDLGKIITGNTPSTNQLENWSSNKNTGHIWVTPADINKKIINNSAKHLSDKGWEKARTLPKNSVLITSIASIGKNAINSVPIAFNQQINGLIPKKHNSYFILMLMDKESKKFASLAGQTATPIINKTTFSTFQINMPTIKEQNEIASLLFKLDKNIIFLQKQISLLSTFKQFLLQNMFI